MSSCSECRVLQARIIQLQQNLLELEDRRSREKVQLINEHQRDFFRAIDPVDSSLDTKQNFIDLLGLLTKIVQDNPNLKGLDSLRSNLDKFK